MRGACLRERTNALSAALGVPPEGEPVTSELTKKVDSALEEAAVRAGLRLFEPKRFTSPLPSRLPTMANNLCG